MPAITSQNVANAIVKLVAADALPALTGNLVMGNLVNRDYEPTLAQAGDTVNIPIAPQLVANNLADVTGVGNATVTPQNPALGNAQIVLNTHAESLLSFVAQATTAPGVDTNSVLLDGIQLPAGGVSFNVYRGTDPQQFFRIASEQAPAPSFTDSGSPLLPALPPDPQFDHVNMYWRWELVPEAPATVASSTTIGNSALGMKVNQYQSAVVRITRGPGAGQEYTVVSNTANTLTIGVPWATQPDTTSFFVVAENSWTSGGSGSASPITFEVPERIGSGIEISARAANASNEEAVYAVSPLTRWTLGQSGDVPADSGVPAAPTFGATLWSTPGCINLGGIAFTELTNTLSITAGTCTFHYYDEVNGPPAITLSGAVGVTDTVIAFGQDFAPGVFLQIEQELLEVSGANDDGTSVVVRGVQGSTAAGHSADKLLYELSSTTLIVPFIKGFFGSPAGGDWQYTVSLPNVRLASAELVMTNSFGPGAPAVNCYTNTVDSGLRTMAGGQYSFQISGYLATQTNAAPPAIADAKRSVRDIYAIVSTAPAGAPIALEITRNGALYATLQIPDGATQSNTVDGFGMPALDAGDQLNLNIAGVGATLPGSGLTVIIRL